MQVFKLSSGSGGGPVLVRLSGGCSVRGTPVGLGWEEGCSSYRGTTVCLWDRHSECFNGFMAGCFIVKRFLCLSVNVYRMLLIGRIWSGLGLGYVAVMTNQ